jgi:hypothetical protein
MIVGVVVDADAPALDVWVVVMENSLDVERNKTVRNNGRA